MNFRHFMLVAMGAISLAGCASAAPSDRAEPEVVGSDSAALSTNGLAHVVSQLENGVAAMAAVVGDTRSFKPKSQGIPHRVAAIGETLSAIEGDVAAMHATFTSSSATQAQLEASTFQLDQLIALVNQVSNDAKTKLSTIQSQREAVSIGDMFEMQMLMNHLSELAEMSTAVVSAANQALLDMARDVKGQ
jgi:hypothetical protein